MTKLSHGDTVLYYAGLAPPYDLPADLCSLDAIELTRMRRTRNPAARAGFVWARLILRQLLSAELEMPPGRVPLIVINGRPLVALPHSALHFSISHTSKGVLVALASGRPIGVDLETIEPDIDCLGVAELAMSEREIRLLRRLRACSRNAAFYRLWARREAILKQRGTGFAGNAALAGCLRRDWPLDLHLVEGCMSGQSWCLAMAKGFSCETRQPHDGRALLACASLVS